MYKHTLPDYHEERRCLLILLNTQEPVTKTKQNKSTWTPAFQVSLSYNKREAYMQLALLLKKAWLFLWYTFSKSYLTLISEIFSKLCLRFGADKNSKCSRILNYVLQNPFVTVGTEQKKMCVTCHGVTRTLKRSVGGFSAFPHEWR